MKALEILKGVHKEELGGWYLAATLDSNGYAFNADDYWQIEKGGDERTKYNPEEKYWWAMCYVKYKTPSHAFYKEANDFIWEYENKN